MVSVVANNDFPLVTEKHTFFKLMHDLEAAGFEYPGNLKVVPFELGLFPARDVQSIDLHTDSTGKPHALVRAWFDGFYGVNSPVPQYIQRKMREGGDLGTNLRLLLDLISNRLYHLLYGVWNRTEPLYANRHSLKSSVVNPVVSLCGQGKTLDLNPVLLHTSIFMIQGNGGRWGLRALLRSVFGYPVEIGEFEPARIPLSAGDRTRLGGPRAILGKTMRVLQERCIRHTHVRIELGPFGLDEAMIFLAMRPGWLLLTFLVHVYTGSVVDHVLVLRISGEDRSRQRMRSSGFVLGVTSVLGTADTDAETVIRRDGTNLGRNPRLLAETNQVIGEIWDAIESKKEMSDA